MTSKVIVFLSLLLCCASVSSEDKQLFESTTTTTITAATDPPSSRAANATNPETEPADQEEVKRSGAEGSSVTYIRWGRKVCDAGAEAVYAGYIGGQFVDNDGGASNFLCLAHAVEWGNVVSGNQGNTNWMHGVEYRFHNEYEQKLFSTANNNGQRLIYNDAPCVVCLVHSRSTSLMIPGRRTCFTGWRKEYSGYLVSPLNSQKRSEFLCLDDVPEVVDGGSANKEGGLLYPVQAACDRSLKCPPYVHGYELSCVVCSL